jgi:hypothetical protein
MISNEVFAAALHCRRKAFFKRVGEAGEVTEIERIQAQLDRAFAARAVDRVVVHGCSRA